jgi:nicotinamidase-related amidase
MSYAFIVVDMLRGAFTNPDALLFRESRKIIPVIHDLIEGAHTHDFPVVFACDSFMRGDFIFKGRMREHAIRGTDEVKVIPELTPQPGDTVLEKRRFSAFFKTDLDQTLRLWNIQTVIVMGVTTHVCVLTTALDAIAHDFACIFVEDGCCSHKEEIHTGILNAYRHSALYPLLRVLPANEIKKECFRD